MKRINFDLVEAQEKIAAQQQCIVSLVCAVLADSGLATLCHYDGPAWAKIAACMLLLFFLALGLAFSALPAIRRNQREMDAWHDKDSSYVQPHQEQV